jgi:RimJ/RimL family protein N-acetyltransferase
MPHGPFATEPALCDWIGSVAGGADPLFFAIVVDGSAVGIASFLRVTPAAGSIEVGWLTFAPRLQRHTAATEAMFLLMQYAFALGYRRYEWKCDALNVPSRVAAALSTKELSARFAALQLLAGCGAG